MKILSKYKCFRSWKCFWKYRLRNGGHFVRGRWVKGVHNFNGFVIWRPLLGLQRWSPPLHWGFWNHYRDVILSAIASEIISVLIVYWTVCSGTDQRKHHSSAPLAFVRRIYRWPMISPHKGLVTWKMLSFDDTILKDPWCRKLFHVPMSSRHQIKRYTREIVTRASDAVKVSIWWRHRDSFTDLSPMCIYIYIYIFIRADDVRSSYDIHLTMTQGY